MFNVSFEYILLDQSKSHSYNTNMIFDNYTSLSDIFQF